MTPPQTSWWDGFADAANDVIELGVPRPFSAYVHIPFCTVRCGYCDFNTYVSDFGVGADRATYHQSVLDEVDFSGRFLDSVGHPKTPLQSIFFGGGTPSLLSPVAVGEIIAGLRDTFGFESGIEVTLEANPDTLDPKKVEGFKKAGVNRVSIGMQSSVPHVLKTLDRTHDAGRVKDAVWAVKDAGLQVSVDLIYGTPGESLGDWEESVGAALALRPDHVSAYSLIIEEGTKMGSLLRRGKIAAPNPDLEADKYLLANSMLEDAGFSWYEISNFASHPTAASTHNLAYWTDANWWGYGAGSHSHLGKSRWWNVRHPTAYAGRTKACASPAAGGEILTAEERVTEQIMLAVRTSRGVGVEMVARAPQLDEGVGVDESYQVARDRLRLLVDEGLMESKSDEVWTLTLQGRLLADLVTRRLLGW